MSSVKQNTSLLALPVMLLSKPTARVAPPAPVTVTETNGRVASRAAQNSVPDRAVDRMHASNPSIRASKESFDHWSEEQAYKNAAVAVV